MPKHLLYILLLFLPGLVSAQGFRTEFGKNRVQTKKFEWKFYRGDKFDVYYSLNGKKLARFVSVEADAQIEAIESFFDYRLEDKITFVLYNSKSDFNQSNMFLQRDAYNIGGTTRILGTTSFIYYNGDHTSFLENIRQGVAHVVLNEMLYGGSLQERLQNSTLLHLPEWYTDGVVNYVAMGWNPDLDSKLRNGVLSGRYKRLSSLSQQEKTIVSHSLWRYIEGKYGQEAVSNVLYVSRVNKSIESGFIFVLGKTLAEIYEEWFEHQYYHYLDQLASFNVFKQELPLRRRIRKADNISRFEFSPETGLEVLTTNNKGKIKMYLVDTERRKRKKLFKDGYKSTEKEIDLSYPVYTLSKSDPNTLYYVYEQHGNPQLVTYSIKKRKKISKRPLTMVDKVYSMDAHPNGRDIVLTGLKNGQRDVFTLDLNTAFIRNVTKDDYDDKDAIWTPDGESIVFSSNRPGTALKSLGKLDDHFDYDADYDLYSYAYRERAEDLVQLTFSSGVDEWSPRYLRDSALIFMQNANGNYNLATLQSSRLFKGLRAIRVKQNSLISEDDTLFFKSPSDFTSYLAGLTEKDSVNLSRIDTVSVYQDTAYSFGLSSFGENILHYSVQSDTSILYYAFQGKNYHRYRFKIPENLYDKPLKYRTDLVIKGEVKPSVQGGQDTSLVDSVFADTTVYPYTFQTGFEDLEAAVGEGKSLLSDLKPEKPEGGTPDQLDKRNIASYYYLSFTPDEVVTQFDIGFFNTPYLPYRENENFVFPQALNGLMRFAISDMFKDYRIEGGIRPSINLRDMDYFFRFTNLKKRLDKEYIFFRTDKKQYYDTAIIRDVTQEIRTVLRYPFNEVKSLRLNFFLRQDIRAGLSTDRAALDREPDNTYWAGAKLEYVFDNVLPDGINIFYGARYKMYYETYVSLTDNKFLNIVGGDFRHYQKIFRNLIWANRAAFASSFGSTQVVYFLGGTDNWLIPRYNTDINVDAERDYIFKSSATNLRGFRQNIRNGASYGLINSELRLPLIRFFSEKPIKSNFLENLQVIGFGDVGVAFNGRTPFSEDNTFNKKIFEQGNVRIERWSLRKPVVGGYGFGIRSMLMGYFVRLDRAWGVESGIESEPVWVLSLGTDF